MEITTSEVTVQTSGDLLDQRHRRQGNSALSKAVSPPSSDIRPLNSEQLPSEEQLDDQASMSEQSTYRIATAWVWGLTPHNDR